MLAIWSDTHLVDIYHDDCCENGLSTMFVWKSGSKVAITSLPNLVAAVAKCFVLALIDVTVVRFVS